MLNVFKYCLFFIVIKASFSATINSAVLVPGTVGPVSQPDLRNLKTNVVGTPLPSSNVVPSVPITDVVQPNVPSTVSPVVSSPISSVPVTQTPPFTPTPQLPTNTPPVLVAGTSAPSNVEVPSNVASNQDETIDDAAKNLSQNKPAAFAKAENTKTDDQKNEAAAKISASSTQSSNSGMIVAIVLGSSIVILAIGVFVLRKTIVQPSSQFKSRINNNYGSAFAPNINKTYQQTQPPLQSTGYVGAQMNHYVYQASKPPSNVSEPQSSFTAQPNQDLVVFAQPSNYAKMKNPNIF